MEEFHSYNRSDVRGFKWMFLLCTWEKLSNSTEQIYLPERLFPDRVSWKTCCADQSKRNKIDDRTRKENTRIHKLQVCCSFAQWKWSAPVRSEGLETETFLVNILSTGSLADSSERIKNILHPTDIMWFSVCETLCFLTRILKKAGHVKQWAHSVFWRTLMGRGRASNEGRREKTRRGEGASDDAAGLKIAPPPYPFCPRHFPPQSLHLLPPSLHHLFL